MKKVALTAPGKFEILNAEKPRIVNDSDVLVRIGCVGICGSDIHYFESGRIGDQIITYPFTPGHECTGTIEAAGSAVSSVKPGDKICIEPAISCGHCDQCRKGREHTCRNLEFLGNPREREGGMQEYLVLPEKVCFKLPADLSLEEGVLIEPLTIALHALSFVKDAGDVAILGTGPIGLCVLEALQQGDPGCIVVTDLIDERLHAATENGAGAVLDAEKHDVVREIHELLPEGVDTVFECCGKQEALSQATDILKPGGSLVIVGIPELDRIHFDIHNLRRREISLFNVRRQNRQIEHAVSLLQKNRARMSRLLTHQFSYRQTQEAFELVNQYKDGVIKAVIQFSQG